MLDEKVHHSNVDVGYFILDRAVHIRGDEVTPARWSRDANGFLIPARSRHDRILIAATARGCREESCL